MLDSKNTGVQKEIADGVKSSRDEEILSLYEDLEKTNLFGTNRKLPLHLFEEYFKDLFMGKLKDPEVIKDRRIKWIDVAGHAGRPVDIFDVRTDKILFTIPAMSDGNLLDPKKAEAVEFALRQYNHHASRSPKSAVAYLIKNKEAIANNLMVKDINNKKRQLWAGFANYYGLSKSSSTNSADNDNEQRNIEDDFEFGF